MGGMFSRLSAATVVNPPLCAGYSSKVETLMINAISSTSDVKRHLETSREWYPRTQSSLAVVLLLCSQPKAKRLRIERVRRVTLGADVRYLSHE